MTLHMLSAGTGETNQSKCEQDSRGHHLFGLYYYMGSGSGVLATSWKLSWEEWMLNSIHIGRPFVSCMQISN